VSRVQREQASKQHERQATRLTNKQHHNNIHFIHSSIHPFIYGISGSIRQGGRETTSAAKPRPAAIKKGQPTHPPTHRFRTFVVDFGPIWSIARKSQKRIVVAHTQDLF